MQFLKSLFARTAASLGFVTRPIASPTRTSELRALETANPKRHRRKYYKYNPQWLRALEAANPGCKFPAAKRHRMEYYKYNPQWFKRAAA